MKILVTGGAGFIGSNFLRVMLERYKDYEFICLDNLYFPENIDNIKELEKYKNFTFIKEDITNAPFIDNLFKQEKFDYVVNFAAQASVDNSIINPTLFVKTNVLGTTTLMDAALKYNVKRFHQISTDEVYGDLPLESQESFTEESLLKPSNPYSASKAAADMLVLAYHRTYGLNVTISRSSNNYGPYQSFRNLIPIVIKNIMTNEKIKVHGNGNQVRDWISVYDHINAIDLIMHKGKDGEIYNISGNHKLRNIDIINIILGIFNQEKNLITYVKDRPGQDLKYSISSSKLEKELNWQRKYKFDEEIIKTVLWYQKHLTTKEKNKNLLKRKN